nr:MAG TPA: hypothetical protein [Podoviridae sp. ctfN46]
MLFVVADKPTCFVQATPEPKYNPCLITYLRATDLDKHP